MDADVNANEMRHCRPRIFVQRCKGSISWSNAAQNRRRHLLAEFLRRKTAFIRTQVKSTRSMQNLEIDGVAFPNDLLIKILLFLPAESLFRMQLVCNNWFDLINSSTFIRCHAQQSETLLIYQKPILSPFPFEENPKSYLHLLNLSYGGHNFVESNVSNLVHILASCDGLVLGITEEKSLMLMNPMTRKHTHLPLGPCKLDISTGSYGVAFCKDIKTYKVVHLFCENAGYGCEILSINERKWRRVERVWNDFLTNIRRRPISLGGSLYWMQQEKGCDYYITMNVTEEKFVSKRLPAVRAGCDRLVEIRGTLGFVTYAVDELTMMQLWVLTERNGTMNDKWVKIHEISLKLEFGFPIPICCLRNGKEMVIASRVRGLNVYSFENQEMKHLYGEEDFAEGCEDIERLYIPHRHTLVKLEDNTSS